MGEQPCEVVMDDVVVADLTAIRHDLALVDLLARLRVAAERDGIALAVRPCDALRALIALVGLSALQEGR